MQSMSTHSATVPLSCLKDRGFFSSLLSVHLPGSARKEKGSLSSSIPFTPQLDLFQEQRNAVI